MKKYKQMLISIVKTKEDQQNVFQLVDNVKEKINGKEIIFSTCGTDAVVSFGGDSPLFANKDDNIKNFYLANGVPLTFELKGDTKQIFSYKIKCKSEVIDGEITLVQENMNEEH